MLLNKYTFLKKKKFTYLHKMSMIIYVMQVNFISYFVEGEDDVTKINAEFRRT